MSKQPNIQQLTIGQFEEMFPDDDACKAYLVEQRWPNGVCCPRCGNEGVYALPSKPFHWACTKCSEPGTSYRFSVLVGTIFENTNKGLRQWFRVIHLMLTSKKGMSALQIQRYMGFGSYNTAWKICHKIRTALMDEQFQKLMGIVEMDQTFIGGKAKNRHKDKRGDGPGTGGGTGRGPKGKIAVIGAVERKGNVVARVVEHLNGAAIYSFVRESVSDLVSLLCTDAWKAHRNLGNEFPHAMVDHKAGQYVVGAVHTNTIEGFWSMVKRGIVGSYHKVSAKYLPLYVAEFQFRYNNRLNANIFQAAVAGC
jgi:transposase-like protein